MVVFYRNSFNPSCCMKLQKKNQKPTLNIWFSPLFLYIYQSKTSKFQRKTSKFYRSNGINFSSNIFSNLVLQAGILNSLILTAFCFGKHFYEFIFVNPFPQIMKIFSLIDVGYIFFNIWTGSMWRVRVTESEYPLSMQSVSTIRGTT